MSSKLAPAPRGVVITGASSGMGRALAVQFALRGDRVVALARSGPRLKSLQREIERSGGVCVPMTCDVRNEAAVRNAIRKATNLAGPIEILVNNAGVTSFKDFLGTTVAEFDSVIETNLRGMFLVTKAVLPAMVKRRSGIVFNILSFAAKTVYTESSAYSASKSGGEALMSVVREELRGKGIKVVNVYPGAVLTPMWKKKHRVKHGKTMIGTEDVARILCEVSEQPSSMMVEEIILRPQRGDVKL